MFWWVALVAVVLLALVAAVVAGRGRSDRVPRFRRPAAAGVDPAAVTAVRPGGARGRRRRARA
ncbi:hypothetical protein SMICM17S_07949 [Streptomyces microflavus]